MLSEGWMWGGERSVKPLESSRGPQGLSQGRSEGRRTSRSTFAAHGKPAHELSRNAPTPANLPPQHALASESLADASVGRSRHQS